MLISAKKTNLNDRLMYLRFVGEKLTRKRRDEKKPRSHGDWGAGCWVFLPGAIKTVSWMGRGSMR
jgi:hypothetical protein